MPHIYAAGDVVGFPGLASTSMEQGRVAMTYACEGKDFRTQLSGEVLPTGIYTIPELSSVGETEESLQAKGIPYVVGKAQLRRERPRQPHRRGGRLREAARLAREPKILGMHVIGPHAAELVHLGAAVMALGGTYRYFIEAVFNYPTLGDTYKFAAYDARKKLGALTDGSKPPPAAPTAARAGTAAARQRLEHLLERAAGLEQLVPLAPHGGELAGQRIALRARSRRVRRAAAPRRPSARRARS